MKRSILLAVVAFASTCAFAQPEFSESKNGLIYSDTTINQLKFIVDSLNLKFKSCDLTKVYRAKLQGKANYISVEGVKAEAVKNDMEAGLSYEALLSKYNIKGEKDLLVTKRTYKNYEQKDVLEFSSIPLGGKYDHEVDINEKISGFEGPLKGKWVFRYYPKSKYSKASAAGFYFAEEPQEEPLADKYARMVQYADCMVDTSTQIFRRKKNEVDLYGYRFKEPTGPVANFLSYLQKATREPVYTGKSYTDDKYEVYRRQLQEWDSLKFQRMDSLLLHDPKFKLLLDAAAKSALTDGGTQDDFEEYVGKYYSKKTELELKRNRIVVGMCSQDNSPRMHALQIAKLSAETVNWEIFLRAHLDIMNDRFERAIDGSYAWGARKTYIKELEVLDINVQELLLGISLRIENPGTNHYYGNVSRIGRALAETKNAAAIEQQMLETISDTGLDDYNRILIYYLFSNYNYNLDDKTKQAENKVKLKAAVKTLPAYLSEKILAGKEEE